MDGVVIHVSPNQGLQLAHAPDRLVGIAHLAADLFVAGRLAPLLEFVLDFIRSIEVKAGTRRWRDSNHRAGFLGRHELAGKSFDIHGGTGVRTVSHSGGVCVTGTRSFDSQPDREANRSAPLRVCDFFGCKRFFRAGKLLVFSGRPCEKKKKSQTLRMATYVVCLSLEPSAPRHFSCRRRERRWEFPR